jgi:inner membrane protein
MSLLSEFLLGLGFWNWFLLGLLLVALEMLAPGVQFLWFGLSAMAVGVLGFALTSAGVGDWLTWPWQLVTFALISVATVFLVRNAARGERSLSDEPTLNFRGEQYVGRVVTVEDAIAGGRGKIRVGDTLWTAQGADAVKGSRVKVTGVNGTVLTVEPA